MKYSSSNATAALLLTQLVACLMLFVGTARAQEQYGLGPAPKKITVAVEQLHLTSESIQGFRLQALRPSLLYHRYAWVSDEHDVRGELLVAVCDGRDTAEFVWRTRLAGFTKLMPTRIVAGEGSRYGDLEYAGTPLFLRNNVFCEVSAHAGGSARALAVAANDLASKLMAIISRAEKPLVNIKRTVRIEEFSASSTSAKLTEEVVLTTRLSGLEGGGEKRVSFYTSSGKVRRLNANQAAVAFHRTGEQEVRVVVCCPGNMVLSNALRMAVVRGHSGAMPGTGSD